MRTRRRALLLAAAALGIAALALVVARRVQRAPASVPRSVTLELEITNPAGRPAVGAHVSLTAAGKPKPRELLVDKAGELRVKGLVPGSVQLVIRLRSAARVARTLALKPGTQRVAIALASELVLRGHVVDDLGQSVAEAKLSARSIATPELVIDGVSNVDGSFELHELGSGSYALEARAAYHDVGVLPALELPRGEPVSIVLPRTATLRGEVVGASAAPAAGAQVTIAGSGVWPPKTIASDEHGHFLFEHIPAGVYELRATRGTFVTPPREGLVLEPGQEAFARLELEPGATLIGRVLDVDDAHPLAAVEVTVKEEALSAVPVRVRTNAQGEFAIAGLRALPHRVFMQPAGYVAVYGELRTPAPEPYEFALERAAIVSGQVVDEQGRGVAHAELEVSGTTVVGLPIIVLPPPDPKALNGERPSATAASAPTADNLGVTAGTVPPIPMFAMPGAAASVSTGYRSDDAGKFRIEGVPAGQIQLVARHAGFAPGRSESRTTKSGVLVENLNVVLPRGATLYGRVLDARDFPVAGVRIQVELEGEPARVAISADDGLFQLDALHGRCSVTAYPLVGAPVRAQLTLVAGQRNELTLRLSGEVRDLAGRVRDPRGIPIARARITVDAANPRAPAPRTAVSADDGTFRITGLPMPPYRVRVEHPSYAPTTLASVSPGLQEELAIELVAGGRVYGVVVDGLTNNGISGVQVRLRNATSKELLQAQSNSQGKFEFQNVNFGKYDIFFDHHGHISSRSRVALASPEPHELDPIVLKPAGSISGAVVDRLGAPVRDAEVALGSPPAWDHVVRTDRLGRFRIADAEPGDRSVSARHYQAGATEDGVPVRVYSRQESPGLVLRLPGQI